MGKEHRCLDIIKGSLIRFTTYFARSKSENTIRDHTGSLSYLRRRRNCPELWRYFISSKSANHWNRLELSQTPMCHRKLRFVKSNGCGHLTYTGDTTIDCNSRQCHMSASHPPNCGSPMSPCGCRRYYEQPERIVTHEVGKFKNGSNFNNESFTGAREMCFMSTMMLHDPFTTPYVQPVILHKSKLNIQVEIYQHMVVNTSISILVVVIATVFFPALSSFQRHRLLFGLGLLHVF